MKRLLKNSIIIILLLGIAVYFTSCKKEVALTVVPVVITSQVSDITQTSALTGGIVEDNGGAKVTDIGVCWSTSPNPTTSSNKLSIDKISIGKDAGSFTGSLTGLIGDTRYYVRAYATNSAGTAYGSEISFSTQALTHDPEVTTTAITSITSSSAVSGGTLLNIQTDFLIESGICWSTSPNPTRDDSKTISVTNSGIFVSILTGLTQGTKYYVRAYALYGTVYDNGILYGNDISFTTKQVAIATLTTTAITNITTASAGAGGNVTSDGGSRITEWGVCWNTSGNPTTDNYKNIAAGVAQGSGIFMGVLPDLNQGTTYYVRAYAVNSEGTAYGNEISFSTLSIVTTSAIVSFSSTSAVVTGNVIYGQIGNHLIGSGVCWSTSHNPTTADSKTPNVTYSGIFTTNLTGLTQGTTYFVKAYAEYDNRSYTLW